MRVLVTYTTLTGNAELVARRISEKLTELGFSTEIDIKDGIELTSEDFSNYEFVFLGASTWGEGDFNPLTEEFVATLSGNPPKLTGRRVAYFGLGETHYDNYCKAIDRLAELFNGWGADQVGDILKIDGYPDEEVMAMVTDWVEKVVESGA